MNKHTTKLLAGCLAVSFLITTAFTSNVFGATSEVQSVATGSLGSELRLSGIDRYETAAKVVQEGWKATSEYAVLSAGMDENLVDALAAAPLSKLKNAPVLLTEGDVLNAYTELELKRLGVKTVYVTTGSKVITKNVLDKLTELNIAIVPLGGNDRFETALNIAKQMGAFNKLVVATAWNNADALSIASIAAAKGMPILLSDVNKIPDNVMAYIDTVKGNVTQTYVLGGMGALTDDVKNALPNATRVGGSDRFGTNLEVLRTFANDLKYSKTYVANGEDDHLADALAGSPLAAQTASPVILTGTVLPSATKEFARLNLGPNIITFGGEAVVPSAVVEQLSSGVVYSEDGATIGSADASKLEEIMDKVLITAKNVAFVNAKTAYSVYVHGDNVVLDNVTITGTLFIDPGANGTANINNVNAGKIVVLSGAKDSIHLKNTEAGTLVVSSSSEVRVESTGTTKIGNTVVSSYAILDAAGGSLGSVEVINITGQAPVVTFKGTFDQPIVVNGAATIKADANASIAKVIIAPESDDQKITLDGKFTAVEVNKEATVDFSTNTTVTNVVTNVEAVLNVPTGASIGTLDKKGNEVSLPGSGSIGGSTPPVAGGGAVGGGGGGGGGGAVGGGSIAVVKTALTDAITAATTNKTTATVSTNGSDVLPASQWVTSEVMTAYTSAITIAQAIADNTAATQTEVNQAVTALVTATGVFNTAKADGTQVVIVVKTALTDAITVATTNKTTATVSTNGSNVLPTDQWVTSAVMTGYTDSIAAAQVVADNALATQAEVDGAVITLATATGTFNTAKAAGTQVVIGVVKTALTDAITAGTTNIGTATVSTDGSDVLPANQWVTSAVMAAYTDAIAAAQGVSDNATATQGEVDGAVTTLATATGTFNIAKAAGTQVVVGVVKTALTDAITVGTTNIGTATESIDGSDVLPANQWVTSAVMAAYTDAIAAAQGVADNATATQEEVDGAVTTLATVTGTFNSARADGSQVAVAVTAITLNKTSTTVLIGGSEALIATVTPSNATNKNLIWTSSIPTIATVDSDGSVLGGPNGSTFQATNITVKTEDGNRTANCSVRVVSEAMVVSDINAGTAANMATKLSQYATLLGLDLTVYNPILPIDRTQVHGALASATFTSMAQIKPAFDTAVAIQVAIQEINAATIDTVGAAITKNASICGLVLTDYNALTNKNPVHTALKLQSIVNATGLKKTLNESVAIEEINSATVDSIGAAITKNATVLALPMTDYNTLTDKAPVHIVMEAIAYVTPLDVQTAFNVAVAVQLINEADTTTMSAVINKAAFTLGLSKTTYNTLINKTPVYIAMETPTFTTTAEVKIAFDAAVSAQKIAETPVTPVAPSVTADDTANIVTGMAPGMEYKLDLAGYVAYDPIAFGLLDFSGDHTLLVRVAAEGINPFGPDTTLTFTTNPVSVVKKALTDAITVATTNIGTASVSIDGTDVLPANQWVTSAAMAAYTNAIAAAQVVADNATATQGEVDGAVITLVTATGTFNTAKADGTQDIAVITASATLIGEALGVKSYGIQITGATPQDVTDVLVNGVSKTFEVINGLVRFNSGTTVTSVKIMAQGQIVDVSMPIVITATATLVGEALGVKSYGIQITGAAPQDVTGVLVNGVSKTFEVIDGLVRFNSGTTVTSIQIIALGENVNVLVP